MSNQLPEPLTPPDCDLRNFRYMELEVARLRDSDIAGQPNAEVFRAAVLAWCASYHQVPAVSLPDDDAAIARLIGMGRDVEGFRALRKEGALRGFIKCSDGRLYHSVVAQKALRAMAARVSQRERTQRSRERAAHSRAEADKGDGNVTVTDASSSSDDTVASQSNRREGKGIEQNRFEEIETRAPTLHVVAGGMAKQTRRFAPDWVPARAWAEFVKLRDEMNRPLDNFSFRTVVAQLARLKEEGHNLEECINRSIRNGWRRVYPPREDINDSWQIG